MKQVLKTIVPLMAITVLAACGSNNEKKMNEKSNAAQETQSDSPSMDMNNMNSVTVHLKDDKLNAVYQHYVHLTTALVNGDMTEAKVAGNAIEAGATQIKGGETIASSAAKITSASNIEDQRKVYSDLSNDFIALVKESGLDSGELYIDFCPMAMNDKGAYWLSSNKEIKNPYFGDKMLTCGEVKETIK